MSALQAVKTVLVDNLDLTKDALHIYVALIVFFGCCLLFKWKAHQWKPWLAVLAVAAIGEAWDIRDNWVYDRPIVLAWNFKDLWNTMLAPTIIMLLARYTRVFRKR
ncbi:hypothetical protein [Altererythrobacter sp. ZODW24]|uniref:hypothetical protein n=1 Tax=Altererythrobacter sp. ZODW24 TaxID=2185142 RepID=UPI000DF824ED|nr:hypothetical protein [Altererythrobacter sp. ZODW24]